MIDVDEFSFRKYGLRRSRAGRMLYCMLIRVACNCIEFAFSANISLVLFEQVARATGDSLFVERRATASNDVPADRAH